MKHRFTITILLLASMGLIFFSDVCAQQVEFNYNGRVKVQGQPFDGDGLFKFSLVNKDASITYWANDGLSLDGSEPTTAVLAPVNNSFFSVNIGDMSIPNMAYLDKEVFARDEQVYLRVWFSDGVGPFELLNPDRKITNVDLLGIKTSRYTDYTIYVNPSSGNDDHSGLDQSKPKRTIQSAVDSLPPQLKCSVTIKLAPGVYRELVNIHGISAAVGKKLRLLGDETWTVNSPTSPNVRITGTDDDVTCVRNPCMYIEQTSGFVIEGLLLDYSVINALYLESCSTFEIRRCVMRDSFRGLFVSYSRGYVYDCLFIENSNPGMDTRQASLWFYDCKFNDNSTDGIYCRDNCNLYLTRCEVVGNTRRGMSLYGNCSADFYETGKISNNGDVGFSIFRHSSARFWEGYTGEIMNNGGPGIEVAGQSHCSRATANGISGNSPNTTTANGGAFY
ncbi:right-handed parallel beta-helix repeat-containing protein [bacterium]|nr:right-handed parallel beta-helix repeat-containing protein [bacterium]